MNWKTKAKIQRAISRLPKPASYATYYWVQRKFGNLKNLNPISRLSAALGIWERIQALGHVPSEKIFLEVGTGRAPIVPLAYWLMGAKGTITIDLNPYLKEEMIKESLRYIAENEQDIRKLFGTFLNEYRMDDLLCFNKSPGFSIQSFLTLCETRYIAPGDAANTPLEDHSIDFHTSYTVLEHIPAEEIMCIS